jgi:hypothetical protein
MAKHTVTVWAVVGDTKETRGWVDLWDGRLPAPVLATSGPLEWVDAEADGLDEFEMTRGWIDGFSTETAEHLGLGHLEPGKAHRVTIEVTL